MTPTAADPRLGFFERLFKYSMARSLAALSMLTAVFVAVTHCFHNVPNAAVIIPVFTGFAATIMGAADWSDTKKDSPLPSSGAANGASNAESVSAEPVRGDHP